MEGKRRSHPNNRVKNCNFLHSRTAAQSLRLDATQKEKDYVAFNF
jgi:hypothetical protein